MLIFHVVLIIPLPSSHALVLTPTTCHQVLDLEFAGIGLRAYDVGLYLETLLFRLIYHHYKGNQDLVSLILHTIGRAVAEYEESCGQTLAREPQFVGQVTGLIGCEEMWR